MQALRFNLSIPRFLLGKALGGVTDSVIFGSFSGLSLDEIAEPQLPAPDWVRLEVLMCGICGSDIAGLMFKTSAVLEPFVSLPAVLGHEVLARITATGAAVRTLKVGDRVVVDPTISCRVRGVAAGEYCASCAAGLASTCGRAGNPGGPTAHGAPLAAGLLIGANTDLPGGFSECMVAHESQVFAVPDALDDKRAVLTESLSIGVHAVLQSQLDAATTVLVIGSGPIAFGTIWALRALGHQGPIIAQVKRAHEATLARALGASSTVAPGAEARSLLLATGATAYQPIVGDEVFAGGGFPVVIDCVGSRVSLNQALHFVTPRGKIILLGGAGELAKLDLTFLWAREIQLVGYVGYGRETWRGASMHTFEITLQLLQETRAPIATLVSHTFPLARYREAFSAAAHRRVSGALKVVVTPR